MKSSYIINKGPYIIRPMMKQDVFSYLNLFRYDAITKNRYYKMYKDVLDNQKEDASDLFFVVLKNGKIIGEVGTRSLADSPCDATVTIVLPQNIEDREEVEQLFIKLCLETYLYDDIYILNVEGTKRRKEMISDSSRRKTS